MRRVGRLVLACALLAATGCGTGRGALFPAPEARAASPGRPGLAKLVVPCPGQADVLVQHVPARVGMPTLVWFHGNAQLVDDLAPLFARFEARGFGTVGVEYPGYGAAAGEPSEDALYRAADAALRHLAQSGAVAARDAVLVGQSLGTGVAVEMARRGHGHAVVLISPYTSIDRVAARIASVYAAWLAVDDHFDNLAKAPAIPLPVLLVHGTQDAVIPAWMSEDLSRAFPQAAALWVVGGHHNDLFARHGEQLVAHIELFALLDRRPDRQK